MTFLDVTPYLTHTCQHRKVARSGFNDRVPATNCTTLTCFAFYGERTQKDSDGRFTRVHGWSIIFDTSVETLITTDDLITEVVDDAGVTFITTATVVKKMPYRHWDHGGQFVAIDLAEL